jgi:hypothetical protein
MAACERWNEKLRFKELVWVYFSEFPVPSLPNLLNLLNTNKHKTKRKKSFIVAEFK